MFSTGVGVFEYSNHSSFKQKLDSFDFTNTSHTSKNNIWKTYPDVFEEIGLFFKQCAVSYVKEFFDYNINLEDFYLDQGWINVIQPYNYMIPHCHRNKYLAMTYYLQTEEKCGNLVLLDPRSNGEWLKPKNIPNDRVDFVPKEGTVAVFPAWIMHYVDINRSSSDRVSLTSNICLKDRKP